MPTSTTQPHTLKQYYIFGDLTARPACGHYQYIPLYFQLTHRPSESVVSRNPLQRVQQSEFASTPRQLRVMPPQTRRDNSAIPSAASNWRKETLDLLNAKFCSRSVTDFTFDGLVLPEELQVGMTCCSIMRSAKYSHQPGIRGTRKSQ